MGFYIRKSVSVGPLRFNLSKSGIGVSAGIRGLRFGTGPRGNYIHMGSNGFYYRQTLPTSEPSRVTLPSDRGTQHPSTHAPLQQITSGSVSQMVDSTSASLLEEIKLKKHRFVLWPLAIAASVVVIALAIAGSLPIWLVIPIGGIALNGVVVTGMRDQMRKSVVVLYDLDGNVSEAYQKVHDSAMTLKQCGGLWHVGARGHVHDPKYHAGAGQLVNRERIAVSVASPPYLRTNVSVICIPAGAETLYLFPDRILIFSGSNVGAVGYESLRLQITTKRFIEEESVPHDAVVVDHTWSFVNKDGGPDRRFSNNRQIPICHYEEIHFQSSTGLNEIIQVSREGVGMLLEESIRAMVSAIDDAREVEKERQRNEFYASDQIAESSSTLVWSMEDLCEVLINALCCVMVSDGRASRSEKQRICELLKKVDSPWDAVTVDERITEFIRQVETRGFRNILEETLARVAVFKQIGRQQVVIRCIDEVANAVENINERELALYNRIREIVS